MKDQCDNDVPSDLVVLDNAEIAWDTMTESQYEAIFKLDWYEVDNTILVSHKALEEATGDAELFCMDLADAGIELKDTVNYIAAILHRGNNEDGWYHA